MDMIIRRLEQLPPSLSAKDNTDHLCVTLSSCIKFMNKQTISSQQKQSLYEEYLLYLLYPQIHSSFTFYLLDKLLVKIIFNDLETDRLDLSKLSIEEWSDATFHQYLLESIINKVKSAGYILSEADNIQEYLCQRISFLSDNLYQCSLNTMSDITRQNHILVMKLHKTLLNHSASSNSILTAHLEIYYTTILRWIMSALPPSNGEGWKFFSQMLKKISTIQTKRTLEGESKFCGDFLEMFFTSVTHLVLCKSDLCGNLSNESLECNQQLNEYLMDEQTGRRLVLSLMELIYFVAKKYQSKDITLVIKKCLFLIRRSPNVSRIVKHEEALTDALWLLENVFMDQDDDVIKYLALLFDIYVSYNAKDKLEMINPHSLFYHTCKCLSFDESVLLDWLMNESSSTIFTRYMTQYVEFATTHFDVFIKTLDGLLVSDCPSVSSNSEKLDIDRPELEPLNLEHKNVLKSMCIDHQSKEQVIDSKPSDPCSKEMLKSSSLLVDYSSSSSSGMEDSSKQYTKPVESLMSCLIRLHFKLERLGKDTDSTDSMNVLCERLEHLEEIYEN